jgi:hypothetical protein
MYTGTASLKAISDVWISCHFLAHLRSGIADGGQSAA